jgi:DNA polymerase III gamma/tau subunit
MTTELYKVYRPAKLDDVVGQATAVKSLKAFKSVPHAILFHGPTGCGKTTLARIMAGRVGCDITNRFDYGEVNCGVVESAIDMVRDIDRTMMGAPLCGTARVWILDEVQSLSRAKFAQEALLKVLEETPPHVYFFLCTTDPRKILAAIRNRCTEIVVKPIPPKELRGMLADVAARERVKASAELLDKIVDFAAGSGRRALVELEKVTGLPEDERVDAVGAAGAERAAFDLVKALLPWKGKPQWTEVARVLKDVEDQEPEGLRQLVLSAARSALLKSGSPQAYVTIDCLREPFWDQNSGRALLAARCYEAVLQAK